MRLRVRYLPVRSVLAFTICLGGCSFSLPDSAPSPDAAAPPAADAPPGNAACPAEYNLAAGPHKLLLTDLAYTWQDAQAFCAAHAGHLVKIEDSALDDLIRDSIDEAVTPFVWIGLYDPQQNLSYKWYDDTPLGAYQNFDPTQTNGDCVDKDTTTARGTWHPWDCSFVQPGVCECDG